MELKTTDERISYMCANGIMKLTENDFQGLLSDRATAKAALARVKDLEAEVDLTSAQIMDTANELVMIAMSDIAKKCVSLQSHVNFSRAKSRTASVTAQMIRVGADAFYKSRGRSPSEQEIESALIAALELSESAS